MVVCFFDTARYSNVLDQILYFLWWFASDFRNCKSDNKVNNGTHYTKGGKLPEIVFPPIDFSGVDKATLQKKRNAELNNGRAAMMGIMGNMVVEKLTGQSMYEQYSSSHFNPFTDGEGFF